VFLLPAGVGVYFRFIKIAIFYLILRFLILDAYTIYWSLYGSYCANLHHENYTDLCLLTISGVNLKTLQDQDKLVMLDWLSLGFTFISILYFWYFRYRIKRDYGWMDICEDVSQENYSLLL